MSCFVELLISGYVVVIRKMALKDKVVLEVACGYGIWGHLLRAMVENGGNQCYLVGCDIWKPYLAETEKYSPYDDLVKCDARFLPFRTDSIDFALAFEVLEHMSKNDGRQFLFRLREIGKKVLVSTPAGYFPQGKLRDNDFEEHRSGWTEPDFRVEGWTTQITGLSVNLERQLRTMHLLNLYHKFNLFFHRNRWAGDMIVAEYVRKT
jgi:SAM-dependent methyltransferase